MDIMNKIISFNPSTGSILVRYYSAEVPDGLDYNIDVPIENGALIPQDQINALITAMAPVGQLQRISDLKNVVIPSTLSALIPATPNTAQPVVNGAIAPPSSSTQGVSNA